MAPIQVKLKNHCPPPPLCRNSVPLGAAKHNHACGIFAQPPTRQQCLNKATSAYCVFCDSAFQDTQAGAELDPTTPLKSNEVLIGRLGGRKKLSGSLCFKCPPLRTDRV